MKGQWRVCTIFSLQLHQNTKATCTLASGAQPPCFSCLLIEAQDGSGQPMRVSLSHRALTLEQRFKYGKKVKSSNWSFTIPPAISSLPHVIEQTRMNFTVHKVFLLTSKCHSPSRSLGVPRLGPIMLKAAYSNPSKLWVAVKATITVSNAHLFTLHNSNPI